MPGEETSPQDQQWHWDEDVPLRWQLVDESAMGESDAVIAACADIEGLFIDSPSRVRETTLLGCMPHLPLRRALDALATGTGNPGGALHRRSIDATLYSVDRNGIVNRVIGSYLRASVTEVRPSVLAAGLVDVTLGSAISEPLPSSARPIWELWQTGGPTEPGLWAGYRRELRHLWSGAALAHHRADAADKPAGSTYQLDGRHVTDIEGFYCAIGEAINGPGGYFGWNGDALHDCVTGGWGAQWPFRLVWNHAEVARTHLTAEFDQILRWLAQDQIEVELR
ncbi:barstar family protein [Micromonospora sp. NPDC049366]|uniref:barstar family protein n=1 Tax=Micromonospora sp. NPDC049366 TaxID=3364271 RepID=UPI0037ACAC26